MHSYNHASDLTRSEESGPPSDIKGFSKPEQISAIRKRVTSSVKKLRQKRLTMLQVEIIDRLMEGRRTATELVSEIYNARPGNEGFESYYSKMRRDLRELGSRGYVSTNLFGRDKPYRLTRSGIAMILSMLPEMGEPRRVERVEICALAVTTTVGIVLWLARQSAQPTFSILFAAFFTLLGVSICAFLRVLRRVI